MPRDAEPAGVPPAGAKLCRGVWLPATERHFVHMIERKSKVGDVDVDGRRVGTYQLHKLREAMKYIPIQRRRTAVDVGAHVGLWAMHLTTLFRHVEAFEPVPLHADIFPFNVRRENWSLHRVALGAAPGIVTLTVPPTVTGNAHAVSGHAEEKGVPTVTVPIATLDSFALKAVDLIKIDVEGAEDEVVAGARATLARWRPWVVLEQKGNDAKFYRRPRNLAARMLVELGMRDFADIGGDHILGW